MNTYTLYSSLERAELSPTRAEIDLGALAHNYRLLLAAARTGTPWVKPICVVKADAYGHGAQACAGALSREGCDFFAVSCLREALALRGALGSAADILILGYTDPAAAGLLFKNRIIQTVFSREYLLALGGAAQSAGVRIRVHLAVDTGMNRIGFPAYGPESIRSTADAATFAKELPGILLCGMFTHFARADEAGVMPEEPGKGELSSVSPEGVLSGEEMTERQFSRYRALEAELLRRGTAPGCRHICNSAAAVRYPAYRLDRVRFGIMLYGLAPSAAVSIPGLAPVMKLKTVIVHIHTLLPGEAVGYGGTFSPGYMCQIATLPVGYADGFLRACTGCRVTVHTAAGDFSAPVVGRICMDQTMIDVSGLPCDVGDGVTVFGEAPGDADKLAKGAGTIGYETVCLVSSRVPRIYRTVSD